MRDFITRNMTAMYLLLCLLAVAVLLSLAAISTAHANASSEKLVIIHDRDEEQGILTKADTLREVFDNADIRLDKNDRVEPGLDEPLLANHYQVNIYRARPIVIVDGAIKQLVMSAYQTPKQIAQHAGIELRDEDEAHVDMTNNFLGDGASLRMTIDRALPIRLTLYGKTEAVYTQSSTLGEFMQEKDITLGKDDDMSLPQSTVITANMQLSIWRNGKQTITQEEDVAFETQIIRDANREVGYRQVETPGKAGKKMVTYEIIMQNGKEVSRVEVQSVVTKQPIKQVETVGSKRPPVAGPAEILNKINAASARLGIDANRVATIAKCESGFNPNADSGYYKGIFQHDPNYWPARASRYGFAGASIFDVDAQIGVSTQMMAGGGWSHWGCDPGN
jgi:resuscitation-promoting factor RpfB